MLFSSLGPVVSAAKAGKVRPLAVTSLKRSNAFPDIPTFDELGYKGFDSTGWFELMGPAGLPPEVVTRLSQALLKAGEDKTLQEQFKQLGKEKLADWHKQADNFLKFMMENFTTELVVMGARVALTTYNLPLVPGKLKNFDEFHKRYGKYIIAAGGK